MASTITITGRVLGLLSALEQSWAIAERSLGKLDSWKYMMRGGNLITIIYVHKITHIQSHWNKGEINFIDR